MKLSGEEKISAPREQVWQALNDPEILKKSITGCKELIKKSDTEFSATVQAKVGPVKATFKGDVKLSKLNPPKSYVLSGQGKGGVAGFAKGKATVKLDEDGNNATILTYDVDAQVGGKLAQIGSRLIGSTAKKMANDFFKKFAKLAAAEPAATTGKKAVTKKSTAKKAPTKKAAAKKAPAKKKAAKKTVAKKQAAARVQPAQKTATPCKPAEQEQPTKIKRPDPNPLMMLILSALGAGIILFFFFMFGM
ncbi:carbon monoxide dehydrogenase G protein [hydrothermal vent metagenome]|uniref:Carbon monoxide dehydrogenase G protein n=1 Tax=hydrothermal vent metagenome TaxID=652676 RepID=A0A3B0R7Z2_9ZZZZ